MKDSLLFKLIMQGVGDKRNNLHIVQLKECKLAMGMSNTNAQK